MHGVEAVERVRHRVRVDEAKRVVPADLRINVDADDLEAGPGLADRAPARPTKEIE